MSYKNGGTGKGSALREQHDQNAINATLDRIEKKGDFKPRCGSCDGFKGVDVLGHAICSLGAKKQKVGANCKLWQRSR